MPLFVGEYEQQMAQRVRASAIHEERIEEAARCLIAANRAARVASQGTAIPAEVWLHILRRVEVLSLGLPEDWLAWVRAALFHASTEYEFERKAFERSFEAKVRELGRGRPLGEQVARAEVISGSIGERGRGRGNRAAG